MGEVVRLKIITIRHNLDRGRGSIGSRPKYSIGPPPKKNKEFLNDVEERRFHNYGIGVVGGGGCDHSLRGCGEEEVLQLWDDVSAKEPSPLDWGFGFWVSGTRD